MPVPSSLAVRSVDSALTPAISIREVGAVGATKTERAGIVKLKSEIKQVCVGVGEVGVWRGAGMLRGLGLSYV